MVPNHTLAPNRPRGPRDVEEALPPVTVTSFECGADVLTGDGSVRFLSTTMPEKVRRPYLTASGGGVIPFAE